MGGCKKKLLFLLYLDQLAIFYLDNDKRWHLMTPLNWSVIMVTLIHITGYDKKSKISVFGLARNSHPGMIMSL